MYSFPLIFQISAIMMKEETGIGTVIATTIDFKTKETTRGTKHSQNGRQLQQPQHQPTDKQLLQHQMFSRTTMEVLITTITVRVKTTITTAITTMEMMNIPI